MKGAPSLIIGSAVFPSMRSPISFMAIISPFSAFLINDLANLFNLGAFFVPCSSSLNASDQNRLLVLFVLPRGGPGFLGLVVIVKYGYVQL